VAEGPPRWGYHRLGSRWAATLVADADVLAGDVVDVGAGTGAITEPLLARGAHVVAVELHVARASALRAAFREARVKVVVADAADLRLPRRPFRVVANPPFGVTTALLKRLTAPGSRLVRADVVVPWHTAERWARGDAPGKGRWTRDFDAWVSRRLPRHAFTPPPPGGVAVLVLRRRSARR
jgi:23S rRNA (adenine-N6)-dimethyltransferase